MAIPMNPRSVAAGQMQGGPPPAPSGVPAQGAPSGPQGNPSETAINILELIVKRLGQVNPELGQKLGAALDQFKAVLEEVKKEIQAQIPASGKTPIQGQPPAGAVPPVPVQTAKPPMPVR